MRKETRDILTLAGVEGAIIGLTALIAKATAKPKPPAGKATLQGTITCAETGLPIPYAKVSINTVECTADENGFYRIEEIPLGSYTITANAPGYKTETIPVELSKPEVYTINVALTPTFSVEDNLCPTCIPQ
jgi:hypothetical protein